MYGSDGIMNFRRASDTSAGISTLLLNKIFLNKLGTDDIYVAAYPNAAM